MRQLAHFEDEGTARTLADALFVEGIAGRVDSSRDGDFVLWVEDEARLDDARELLRLYEEDPGDARFQQASKVAGGQRRASAKKDDDARKKSDKLRSRLDASSTSGYGKVTLGLIFICVGVAFAMAFTDYDAIHRWLNYVAYEPLGQSQIQYVPFGGLRDGQLWRLITPTFVHAELKGFGIFHLFFNMYWLKDLGSMVERNQGALFLIFFVIAVSLVANTAEYVFGSPLFHGFSGVILGLYGYMWVRAKLEPSSAYAIPQSWGLWLIGFYLAGLFGLFPGVANWVHSGGLVTGALFGAIAATRSKSKSRRGPR
ncbi:MAG: rhomboid family intramembrane serine protease [Deltaproteobacteria bacterium]|nr:rhomboid family intramembrane serine protease [Deltaproteobacteria bacterium]